MKDVEKYLETNHDNGIFNEKVNIVDAMIMISSSIEKVAFVLNDVASALQDQAKVLNRPSPIEVELSGSIEVDKTI